MGKPIKLELESDDIIRIQAALEMLIDYYQTGTDMDKVYAKDIEETYNKIEKQV